jgi:hypothetical protein
VKYIKWTGPDVTLVTGHFTGPVENGEVRTVADTVFEDEFGGTTDLTKEQLNEVNAATGEQRTGSWVELTADEVKDYEASLKKAAKKTGIAKPEVVKTEEVQSQGQQ